MCIRSIYSGQSDEGGEAADPDPEQLRVSRRTKTRTQSRILATGDLLEQVTIPRTIPPDLLPPADGDHGGDRDLLLELRGDAAGEHHRAGPHLQLPPARGRGGHAAGEVHCQDLLSISKAWWVLGTVGSVVVIINRYICMCIVYATLSQARACPAASATWWWSLPTGGPSSWRPWRPRPASCATPASTPAPAQVTTPPPDIARRYREQLQVEARRTPPPTASPPAAASTSCRSCTGPPRRPAPSPGRTSCPSGRSWRRRNGGKLRTRR